jgi:tetratricopeptide (TPR) repeat protein
MKFFVCSSLLLFFFISSSRPQSLPEIIKNGQSKIAASDFQGAEQDFANAIKLNVEVVNVYLDKMKSYSTMNEYQRSTSDMPDGFIYNHDLAVPYYGHGLAMEGLQKQEEALADYEKAVSIDPKYADALCQRGVLLIAKGTNDKGCMDLRKAKVLGSAKAKELYEKNTCSAVSATFLNSGNTKFEAKDYKGALEDYTAAIQLNSDSTQPYVKRGECNVMLKKFDKAIADYNKALKINPDTVKFIYLRGLAYMASENYKMAFNDFSMVIKKDPNNYDAFMQRGASCEGLQNFKSAAYDYSEAIRIRPKDGNAYYKRGIANQDAKDNSACKDFKMAAALGIEDAKPMAEGCAPAVAKPK